jgi:hypothetical protein
MEEERDKMKPNTSNNDEHALKMPEIIDYIHTSGLFTECNDDKCMKCGCPAYASCPNCIMHKMEDVFKQGYAKALDDVEKIVDVNINEVIEILSECTIDEDSETAEIMEDTLKNWKKFKQEIAKLKESK